MNEHPLSRQPQTDAAPRSRLFNQIVTFFERAQIRYSVVGDTRPLPEDIDGDVDFVVDQSTIDRLPGELSRFCRANGLRLVQVIQHEATAYFCVIASQDSRGRVHCLQADICGDYFRNGKRFLTAEELLDGRTVALDQNGREKGFYVSPPAAEFIYYLLKKVDKQQITDVQGRHLSRQWQQDPIGARQQVKRFWPTRFQSLIEHAARNDSWKTIRQLLPDLRDTLHKGWSPSLRARRQEAERILTRVSEPSGLFLSVMGADGSGKSSVCDRILQDLAPAFWDTAYVHLRPKVGIDGSDRGHPAVTDPHGQSARNPVSSMMKSLYYVTDYNLGYAWNIKPRLIRSNLVVFDRYFHDMLVDPARYRYGGPERVNQWFSRLLPRPELFIFLDAPAEILRQRKQEVSPEETQRQCREYRDLADRLENAYVVDASQPLDAVVADVERLVLDYMETRTAGRFETEVIRDD